MPCAKGARGASAGQPPIGEVRPRSVPPLLLRLPPALASPFKLSAAEAVGTIRDGAMTGKLPLRGDGVIRDTDGLG